MSDQPNYPSYPGAEPPEQTPPAYGQPLPPPPGYQPPPPGYGQQGYPPPPPGYGQAPAGPGQWAPGYPTGPAPSYAGWWLRVGASLLDALIALGIVIIPLVVGLVIAFKDAETDPVTGDITGGVEAVGVLILVLTALVYLAFSVWNTGIRVGTKGQSLGKQIVGIRIIKADTGQHLGAGGGFLRWLMTTVFGAISCVSLLDYLWPLWDDRNQTLHDKVVGSIAVRA